jgi:hypothetical protein
MPAISPIGRKPQNPPKHPRWAQKEEAATATVGPDGTRTIQLVGLWNHYRVATTLGGAWVVSARVSERHGRLVVTHLEVGPLEGADPSFGLTSRELARLSIPGAIEAARRVEREANEAGEYGFDDAATRRLRRGPRATRQGASPGDDYYGRLALDYNRALKEAPSGPNVWLAKRRKQDVKKITDHIRLARKYEWIPESGGYGRPRGGITPKLQEWLDQQQKGKGKKR